MKKIYLTMSQTRMLSSEYPVGDPTGGPAYGKKEAPVIGIAMMYGAATAATVGTLATVAAGLTFVGGFMTTVGSLSGNEKMTKMGSYFGMAAAGAGLASWATSASGAASASGAGAKAAANAGPTADPTVLTAAGDGAKADVANNLAKAAIGPADGGASVALTENAASPVDDSVFDFGAKGGGDYMNSGPDLGGYSDAPIAAPNNPSYAGYGVEVSTPTEPGPLDRWMAFAKENPKVAEQAFGLVGGAANAYSSERDRDSREEIAKQELALRAEKLALEKELIARKRANANNITQLSRFASPGGVISQNMRAA